MASIIGGYVIGVLLIFAVGLIISPVSITKGGKNHGS